MVQNFNNAEIWKLSCKILLEMQNLRPTPRLLLNFNQIYIHKRVWEALLYGTGQGRGSACSNEASVFLGWLICAHIRYSDVSVCYDFPSSQHQLFTYWFIPFITKSENWMYLLFSFFHIEHSILNLIYKTLKDI